MTSAETGNSISPAQEESAEREEERVPEQLVSEDDLDGEDYGLANLMPEPRPDKSHSETALDQLERVLPTQGFAVTRKGDQLVLELPAGRSHRPIYISADIADELLELGLEGWRSLERFDGIWNSQLGVIEVALRGERIGFPPSRLVSILAGRSVRMGEEVNEEALELVDDHSKVRLRFATASPVASVLLGSRHRFRGARPPMTLTVDPVRLSNTAGADELIEALTDSLSLQVGMRRGTLLTPRRLEDQEVVRSQYRRPGGSLNFPMSRFPHAPVALYLAGRERTTSPLLRYWAFYQVLEYFFPKYARAEMLQRISQVVRSPTFDPHSDEDIIRLASVTEFSGARLGEEDQLTQCLGAIVTVDEVRRIIQECELVDRLADKKSRLSSQTVNVRSEDLLVQLSRRIYDIRCRIVHSKSASHREGGAGLLPGTSDEDVIRFELPLIDFLSEKALVASSDRLDMRVFEFG